MIALSQKEKMMAFDHHSESRKMREYQDAARDQLCEGRNSHDLAYLPNDYRTDSPKLLDRAPMGHLYQQETRIARWAIKISPILATKFRFLVAIRD
jgi:hypothetical protein